MTFGRSQYGTLRLERFPSEHVERSAAQPPVPQRVNDCCVVDQLAARDIDE